MEKVLIVDTVCSKSGIINKDVNGGLGTRTKIGSSFRAQILEHIKKQGVVLPLIELAYISAILKSRSYSVDYLQIASNSQQQLLLKQIDRSNYEHIIFFPALVSYSYDLELAQLIKKQFPAITLGAIGPFVSACSDKVLSFFDWIIAGEVEPVLIKTPLHELKALVTNSEWLNNLDELPFPDWSLFQGHNYSYRPMLTKVPFFTMQGSRGCPMSCSFYCPYPASQGTRWRTRSVASLVDEIDHLQTHYNARSILFRDPFFSLKKDRTVQFAEALLENKIKIQWACETGLKTMDKELLKLLFQSGLRSINIGIESEDDEILKLNKRKQASKSTQTELIDCCHQLGIKVNAFFILGLTGDTEESIKKTIAYAKSLKTYAVQFTINTPLPGTPYYEEMRPQLIEQNLEKFDNNTLVFNHPNLSKDQLEHLKEQAFLAYYFRPRFLLEQLRWKIRELSL